MEITAVRRGENEGGLLMDGREMCPECGVPRQFVSNHVWESGGYVTQSGDRSHRMVLIDSDNLDHLFKGIEEIIGVPIERIVMETKRRATRGYIEKLVPDNVKEMARRKELDMEVLIHANNDLARTMGYGNVTLVGYRYERDDDDYLIQRVQEPYSVPLWCGDIAGAVEAITGRDNDMSYEVVSPDTIEIKSVPAEHPPQFQGRLEVREYTLLAGDIELPRCGTCGGPTSLAGFTWDLDRGVITDRGTGRRMAMLGPTYQEAVFDELARELGEELPGIVVEAQRRFAKSGFYRPGEIRDEEQYRELLALRGMGNLRYLDLKGDRLRLRLENAALHLMFIGLMQAYFETVARAESAVEWELSEDGVLELEVRARS